MNINSDTLFLKSLDSTASKHSLLLTRIDNLRQNKFPNFILIISSCANDPICQDLKFEINLNDKEFRVYNFDDSTSNIYNIDDREKLILKNMLNQVNFSSSKKKYISNFIHAKYFHLKLISDENIEFIFDSGDNVPGIFTKIATYLWATYQIKNNPTNYQKPLMSGG
ncbi:hypothetical protein [Mangrovivirga cuniculi]|uniref:Uncharacterized protein n=1 Tax=Mangrovivirga cuniculi TaxID=2715131 RepID=A0A4D7K834_9BACT|nr:hypothetical protein [Mangrovivirga cuniculi]QCK15478.1 hypothetical protein DCC35_12350 [Mangrovivirga cuniculi]